jgi:hypothetical protein
MRHERCFGAVGQRSPATLLALDERDALLREAARRFYADLSHREAARLIRIALVRYRAGRWRRTRADLTYPPEHRGRIEAVLWMILRTRDHVASERLIRAVLSRA